MADPLPFGSSVAHKLAAVALVIVAAIVALILHYALFPDYATHQACVQRALKAGGSGQGASCGANLSYLVPFLVMMAAFAGASRVWR